MRWNRRKKWTTMLRVRKPMSLEAEVMWVELDVDQQRVGFDGGEKDEDGVHRRACPLAAASMALLACCSRCKS